MSGPADDISKQSKQKTEMRDIKKNSFDGRSLFLLLHAETLSPGFVINPVQQSHPAANTGSDAGLIESENKGKRHEIGSLSRT